MLPNNSRIKKEFDKLTKNGVDFSKIKGWVENNLSPGSIDVNIMTKVDKDNYIKNEKQPIEYNDAHAALRGFANSRLKSSVILSAGMNPRLYTYISQFEDFYPNEQGSIKKKIILKVSDYRSALIQGKFLAKKGLWVSEYRVESGLNCGGHAFATDAYLLGPVLSEFREKRNELKTSVQDLLDHALKSQGRMIPQTPLSLKISAQGGVGTDEEHEFLLDYYQLDSIGWGSPFLLVPEATTVDAETLRKLEKAKEEDLYLSDISPLGIPFNNLKDNTKDAEKELLINKGRPGSSCPKKFVALNKEFTEKGMCTASRQYQYLKIKELENENISSNEYKHRYNKITEKSCTCVGLGTSALLAYNLDTKTEGKGVSICPGPNLAYYSKTMSLKEITDHIYGRSNVIKRTDRPNVFVKELHIYIDYLKKKIEEAKFSMNKNQEKHLSLFNKNLKEGVLYYITLFNDLKHSFNLEKSSILNELKASEDTLNMIDVEMAKAKLKQVF